MRSQTELVSGLSRRLVEPPAREWSRGDASDIDGQAERPKRAGANESTVSECLPRRLKLVTRRLVAKENNGPATRKKMCTRKELSVTGNLASRGVDS
jgi:hypothetical protein